MKPEGKHIAYWTAVAAFVVYLFSADYIFNSLIKTDQEAKRVEIRLPSETHPLRYAIDEAKPFKLKWKEALALRGWVFRNNVKENTRDVYLILKGKGKALTFDIANDMINRQDVTDHFQMGGDVHGHGFELALATYRLKEKSYRIGFLIEDESGRYYHLTAQSLVKSGGVWSVTKTYRSERATISLREPSATTKHHVDLFEDAPKTITIAGWGFLNGLDTNDIQHYLLFKNGDRIEIVSTIPQTREDVTAAFRGSKINLDKSGYMANVPKDLLPRGRYQIGLYIVKGKDQGMIFFDRYITIE